MVLGARKVKEPQVETLCTLVVLHLSKPRLTLWCELIWSDYIKNISMILCLLPWVQFFNCVFETWTSAVYTPCRGGAVNDSPLHQFPVPHGEMFPPKDRFPGLIYSFSPCLHCLCTRYVFKLCNNKTALGLTTRFKYGFQAMRSTRGKWQKVIGWWQLIGRVVHSKQWPARTGGTWQGEKHYDQEVHPHML